MSGETDGGQTQLPAVSQDEPRLPLTDPKYTTENIQHRLEVNQQMLEAIHTLIGKGSTQHAAMYAQLVLDSVCAMGTISDEAKQATQVQSQMRQHGQN
eukprot:m.53020 g.53020  ORF g.53020 m.53020 type:complete len:98 (-) comp11350_c0_seq2:387-680(-)